MNWQHVASLLAQRGFPVIGRIIGGELMSRVPIVGSLIDGAGAGEAIGRKVAVAVAIALGVPATPEAIATAIETRPDAAAQLELVEKDAATRYGALVEIAKTDAATEQAAGELNANTFLRNREIDEASDTLRDNFWMTLYRPVAVWTATVALIWMLGLIMVALTMGGAVVDNLVRAETLVLTVLTALFGVLFGHWVTVAAQKRKALDALGAPDKASGTTTVTTVKK